MAHSMPAVSVTRNPDFNPRSPRVNNMTGVHPPPSNYYYYYYYYYYYHYYHYYHYYYYYYY